MRFAKTILIILFSMLGALTTARATTQIHINLSTQTMQVKSSSGSCFRWPISTARSGYSTPRGSYAPTGLQRMHYSKKYHMSPMPYSIFFRGGYAIHGTYATGSLGKAGLAWLRAPGRVTPRSSIIWCRARAAAFPSRARLPAPPASPALIAAPGQCWQVNSVTVTRKPWPTRPGIIRHFPEREELAGFSSAYPYSYYYGGF